MLATPSRSFAGVSALAALLLLAAGGCAAASGPLLAPGATDWAEWIGPPPAQGSRQAHEDLAIVLWVQRTRSPSDVDRVWAAMSPSVGSFQQAVGTMVLPEAYPKLYAAVQDGLDAATPVFAGLKSRFERPRPATVDPRVDPCTPTPASGSYPSGTAALGIVAGRLLADLVPQRKAQIDERAEAIAELRVTAGVHFPSDVEAGTKLGEGIAEQILASEAWRQQREGLTAELAALRKQLHGAEEPAEVPGR